jgi:hypothetical protein
MYKKFGPINQSQFDVACKCEQNTSQKWNTNAEPISILYFPLPYAFSVTQDFQFKERESSHVLNFYEYKVKILYFLVI